MLNFISLSLLLYLFSMHGFIIEVKGTITATEQTHYAQEWTSLSDREESISITNDFKTFNHERIIRSNLILNKNCYSIPYAVYYSKNNIIAKDNGDIAAAQRSLAALCYLKDNIKSLRAETMHIESNVSRTYINGLYVSAFSALELFLCDALLCEIFSNDKFFWNAITHTHKHKQIVHNISNKQLIYKLKNYFTNSIVYHRFKEVDTLYYEITGVHIPNHDQLSFFLRKRNNMVHRFSLSNIDRMQVTLVNTNDLFALYNAIEAYAIQLHNNLESLDRA